MKTNNFKFGGISSDTEPTGQILQRIKREQNKKLRQLERRQKLLTVEKQVDTILEGYNCENRVQHKIYLCDNNICICQFKKYLIEDVKLHINKLIIREYYNKNKLNNKYTDSLFKLEWKSDKLKGSFTQQVYPFIRNCKFIYGLDLLIDDIKIDKSATDTYHCKDRVPHKFWFCKGRKYTDKIGNEIYCHCHYSNYTPDQLDHEVMKEWIINNKDVLKLNQWDRIALTYNWNNLTDNQIKVYNSLLLKCILYVTQKQKTQTKVVKRTKLVKRKKITP